MKKPFLLIPFLLVSCGKGGSSSPNEEKTLSKLEENSSVPSFTPKFLDEDLYYTLNSKGTLPKMSDSRYINVEVKHDKSLVEFNYEVYPEGVRTIKITGLDLRLGTSDGHSIFEVIKKTFDVKKLIILARKVEIFDEIHIAGGDVEIRAEEVVFQGKGRINTTPVIKTELPQSFKDGVSGLNAGNITIISNNILRKYPVLSADGSELPFLIASGGDGQAAGPGLDGARGTNIHTVEGTSDVYEVWNERCLRDHPGGRRDGGFKSNSQIMSSTSSDSDLSLDCHWNKKKGRPSTNGQDAKVGGMPGHGGLPGKITLSQDFKEGILSINGNSGDSDRVRMGGEAGLPVKVCKRKDYYNGRKNYFDCVTSVAGKSVEPKVTITSKAIGEKIISQESFLNAEYLKTLNLYATDAYKENHLEVAYDLFKKINESIKSIDSQGFSKMELTNTIESNISKIDSHKDFYGHDKTWTPNIAFEVSYKIFEKEMKASLKNLYYAKAFLKKSTSLDKKKEMLDDMQDNLYLSVNQERASITSSVHKANAIETAIEDLKVAEDEFNFELKLIEERIRREAKNSLKTPFLNKALKVVSVASKCIPVGQPTFAAIGVAADLLDKATTKGANLGSIMKEIPDAAKSFQNFDWKKATGELDAKLNELDPSVFSHAKNNKERVEYLKNLSSFSTPIYKAVSEQVRAFKASEVSSSKLEQMIQSIKMKDKSFLRVTSALDKLLQKKKHFVKVTQEFNQKILSSLDLISKNYIQMAKLSDDNLALLSFENSELSTIVSEIERNSIERLSYYHYLFSKSYEYRMLNTYNRKFSYENIASKIEKMQTLNVDSTENNIEELLLFYKSELSDIVHQTITDFEKLGSSHQMNEEVRLTREEEESLNRGEEIFIDLREVFSSDKKDIRLNTVKLMNGFNVSGAQSDIELKVQHSGTSLINKNGKIYLFNHDSVNQPNLTWYSYQGLNSRSLSYSELSLQEGSLFEEMLGLSNKTKLLTQPGARTFISLKLRKHKETKVSNMALVLDYSFKL